MCCACLLTTYADKGNGVHDPAAWPWPGNQLGERATSKIKIGEVFEGVDKLTLGKKDNGWGEVFWKGGVTDQAGPGVDLRQNFFAYAGAGTGTGTGTDTGSLGLVEGLPLAALVRTGAGWCWCWSWSSGALVLWCKGNYQP
jgi:hypothetical protein